MPQIYDMGPTALLPLRRKACWGFFRPLKIRRLRPGLNPRTWVLKASTLPLDLTFSIWPFKSHISAAARVFVQFNLESPWYLNLKLATDFCSSCRLKKCPFLRLLILSIAFPAFLKLNLWWSSSLRFSLSVNKNWNFIPDTTLTYISKFSATFLFPKRIIVRLCIETVYCTHKVGT